MSRQAQDSKKGSNDHHQSVGGASSVFPLTTETGAVRRIGVEIEFSGVLPVDIMAVIQRLYSGEIVCGSPFSYRLLNSQLGDFKVELDASYLRKLGSDISEAKDNASEEFTQYFYETSLKLMSRLAETLVPWEITTAPMAITNIRKLQPLMDELREKGALGTRHSLQYAFGIHLNPELANLNVTTVLAYIRAFICLYEWLCEKENIDFARRVTPFINHYPAEYIALVCREDYQPDMDQLIDDYVAHNATRNRALDMLPLFSFIDESRLAILPENTKIMARPTLHYRLPNCEIDDPSWSITDVWVRWCQVELLAYSPSELSQRCKKMLK